MRLCDLLVFDLKVVDAKTCGDLTFDEIEHWIRRAVAKKLLK